jgi:hypothetical protein
MATEKITLDKLREMKEDWDWDDDGIAPTEEAINLAELILNTPPAVVPRENGGVQIEWHCGGEDAEIVITPEGTLELE